MITETPAVVPKLERTNILLVDDRPEGLLALEAVVGAPDYKLTTASSGWEALSHIEKNSYAVVLLDVQMPEMDGFETARRIREKPSGADLPIIFVTAINTDDRHVYTGYESGAVDYIFKPFDPFILRSKISIFVDLYKKKQKLMKQALQLREAEKKDRERLLAKLELENLKRYQGLADAIPHIIWKMRSDGTMDYVNNVWKIFTGLSLEQSNGRGWYAAIDSSDLLTFLSSWDAAQKNNRELEVEIRIKSRKSNEYRWHLVRGVQENNSTDWILTCTNIHDRKMSDIERAKLYKQAQAALAKLSERTTALDVANCRLRELALVDPLTSLLNRRGLQQVLSVEIPRISVEESDFLAMLVDIDDFKAINDAFGHVVGDVVLKEITRKLKASLRANDYAARIGGDEFMILLPKTRMAEGWKVAEKLRLAIADSPILLASGEQITVTASIGLVRISDATPSIDQLLSGTHLALSKSKKGGKNMVTYEAKDPIDGSAEKEIEMSDIIGIFRNGIKFNTVKQPIYSLNDHKKIGFEFLSRSPVEAFEMPDDFFRLCVKNKILTHVDHQCFRACLAAAADIKGPFQCHINLFPSTIITIPIEHLLAEFPSNRSQGTYCIEISEQQIIGDPSYLMEPIERLKKAGIHIAIDDVGFGRSCLESLILLEPQIIKIDKRCVQGIATDEARTRSLKRILNVAESLNTQVVAEGIEHEDDLAVLKDLGIKYGQGFLLQRPE